MNIKSYFTQEERIQQVKECGQAIMDNAERIIGDFKYSQGVRIVVEIERNSAPSIRAERQFIPESYIERIM